MRDALLKAVDATSQHEDKSVLGRAVSLLACFGSAAEPLTITNLCAQTGLPPATVHRLVARLVDSELVERPARGRYELGERAWRLGRGVNKISRLRESARPVLVDLHVALSCQVLLLGLDPLAGVVVIDQIAGSWTWCHQPLDRALCAGIEDIFMAFEPGGGSTGRASTDDDREEGDPTSRSDSGWP